VWIAVLRDSPLLQIVHQRLRTSEPAEISAWHRTRELPALFPETGDEDLVSPASCEVSAALASHLYAMHPRVD
jgi:hypothetical protein